MKLKKTRGFYYVTLQTNERKLCGKSLKINVNMYGTSRIM
jgi:hypothetical protein